MRVEYNPSKDLVLIEFKDAPYSSVTEVMSGVILRAGESNEVVAVEIRNASRVIERPTEITLAFLP